MKVLVIGLDGATFDVIEPLVSQGRLPNLASLLATGSYGNLRSTVPPITPVAWTSFMTGKQPLKHGIFDFDQVRTDYSTFPVPANQHNHKSLWRLVNEEGRKVIALDIPFTYPPEEVRGVLTCGFGAPKGSDASFCYPPQFAEEMRKRFGSFPVAVPDTATRADPRLFAAWDRIMDNRAQVVPYVHQNYEWDLFMVVFGVTDNILHALWTYLEPQHPDFQTPDALVFREQIATYYARVDQVIGDILAQTDSDTRIFVISDHGFGTTATRDYLAQFLIDHKFVRYKGKGRLSDLRGSTMKQFQKLYYAFSPLRFLLRGLSPRRKTTIKNILAQAVDWSRTYVLTGTQKLQLLLYINRAGKFAQGIPMTEGEYSALLVRLKELLLDLRDPNLGRPILSNIHETGHIDGANHHAIAPDLVLEYANFFSRDRLGAETTSNRLEGNHVPDGILVAKGPGIAQGKVEPFDLVDVAPTVLYSLGLPIPSDMDGRVMDSLFVSSVLQETPPTYSSAPAVVFEEGGSELSAEDAEKIREHLRDLGYL